MASYRNVGVLNSPNTNNNNNNHIRMSSTLNRDLYDYSSAKYNQQQNSYKNLTMSKTPYQNIQTTTTTSRDFLPKDNGTNYLTATSSYDSELNSNMNEPSKRITNPNGKFSIQKMIRHGFSSWRTRKKPPSTSTSPQMISSNSIYTNTLTPPSSSSSSSQHPFSTTERYMPNNYDYSQIPPPTATRSISVDSITNRITSSPQQKIITESRILPSPRSNSVDSVTVDFDRPQTVTRAVIQSPWTNSSISSIANNTTTITPVATESIARPAPVPVSRILPVQFAENNKIPSPRSPPPPPPISSSSAVSPLPPSMVPLTTTRTIETNNSTTPITTTISNPSKIPPPGMLLIVFLLNLLIKFLFQLLLNLILIV